MRSRCLRSPKGRTRYYGIQCKGKDDYANAVLTRDEVDKEIGKARSFVPPLEEFIIATTANKDAGRRGVRSDQRC